MKQVTVTTYVYQFSELSDEAKAKAIEEMYDINVDHDWCEYTYEDAKEIGLKITGFDTDRGSYCEGELTESLETVIEKILENHGDVCDTYKLAIEYKEKLSELDKTFTPEDREETYDYDNAAEELEADFLKALCEEYLIILRNEYEYLTSEEAIIETIEANEYEFTIDGNRYF